MSIHRETHPGTTSPPISNAAARRWFATCPKGVEALLAAELATLGAETVRETVAGVYFDGALAIGYRACLWSRLANRVLLPLGSFAAGDADDLYRELRLLNWAEVIGLEQTFAIDFSGENQHIRNTQFGAQRSKDAIVDWFQDRQGQRPSVAKRDPDIRLNIRLAKTTVLVALDFSGGSLHRRGYRLRAGAAPLKENLAAALLFRADWPGIAARGGALIDPMCGAATLLLEGAMMAADMAPGLGRQRFGFEHWAGHNRDQWAALINDASARAERGLGRQLPPMRGYDADAQVVRKAQQNIAQLGLEGVVRVTCKPLAEMKKPTHMPMPHGLLICNPPYGERMGEKASVGYLYQQLGETMAREFNGWQAAIFTGDIELGRATGLRSHKQYKLWNGALPASLLLFDLTHNELRQPAPSPVTAEARSTASAPELLSAGALMFANRIRKNQRRLASWIKREGIDCYRLYDADMPEYAVAIDIYGERVHVAEYQAPKTIEPEVAAARMEEIQAALPVVLGTDAGAISYKLRQRQRGSQQYIKQADQGELLSVSEGRARLLVNLRDYLDTGLFLDHRPLRLRIASAAKGGDMLNLFCYTGAATVHAALGGARTTTSVDLSKTYLGWLRKNLAHNGLDETRNIVLRDNCLEWVSRAPQQYDLILLDPPSFSNSRALSDSFDVQRDHLELVRASMRLLRPGGTLWFSNNRRGFKLNPSLTQEFDCKDIGRATLDVDFKRNPKIHCCWELRHYAGAAK